MAGVPQTGIDLPANVGQATPTPYVDDAAFGSGLGASIAQAGGMLHQDQVRALTIERQRQAESDNAQAGLGAAQLKLGLTELAQKSRDAAPLDGSGHVDTVATGADKLIGDYLGSIKDPRTRSRWTVQAADMRSNLLADEDGWARGRRIDAVGTSVKEAGRLWDNQLQGDPSPTNFEQSLKQVDTTLAGFDLPADAKDKLSRQEKASRAENYGTGLVEKDPVAALAVFKSGVLDPWLEADTKRQLIDRAETGVRVADADARRVQAQTEAQFREDVGEYTQRINRGELPSDKETEDLVKRGQALNLPNLVDNIEYSQGKLKYSRLTDKWTSTEWETNVNQLAAKVASKKASAGEQQELQILQELRPSKEARFRNDPDGYAAASGMQPPQVDISNPDAGAINARKSWARAYAGQAGLLEPPYLNKDQLNAYRQRTMQGPVGQLDVATELKQVWGEAAPSIVRQIGGQAKDDMMVMLGLNPGIAQVYRQGVDALSKKSVAINGKAEEVARQVFRQYAQGVPADMRPALFDVARNIAAGWMGQKGFTEAPGNFDQVFQRSLHYAGGMLGDGSLNGSTGGFVQWNGRYAWLPPDMGRADFQRRISGAAPHDWVLAAVDPRGNPVENEPYHMGTDGKLKPYTRADAVRFGKGTLQTVAPGIYRLIDPLGGTVMDKNGQPWQFDVRRLPRSHVVPR